MLESLYVSRSKIRQELFALFFTNPQKRYYLREMERILGCSAGSIRRELLRFQKDGLFNTDKVGNLLYYSLNTRHPLFKELKAIVSKTVGVEASLRKEMSAVPNIEMAFIYGSFAANKEKSASDIDLMVIGNPKSSLLNEKLSALERRLKREINPTVYSMREYKAKKRVRSGFIMDLLRNPKIMILGKTDDL